MMTDHATVEAPVAERSSEVADLVRAARALAGVMRHADLGYAESADRITAYDSQPYPLPYVFMSTTVAAFLRALAAARGAGEPSTATAHPRPGYGPSLRDTG